MDGVLADFASAFRDVEVRLYGPAPELPIEQPEEADPRPERGPLETRQRHGAVWQEIQRTADFWRTLEPIGGGTVRRLHDLAIMHRWEVFFITRRPATAGETVQRQTQRWLVDQGFDLPSVLVLNGPRGAAVRTLALEYHVDDSAENCLDVIADSTARPILVSSRLNEGLLESVRKLGVAVASGPEQALDILEQATLARSSPSVLARLAAAVGWKLG